MGNGHGAHNPIPYYLLIHVFRFLLASLNIQAILQEPTIHLRRERLRNMTDGLGLGDIYEATIERIKAQGGHKLRLGMGALMWICYAEVPLSLDELCHALAIELGSSYFNASNIPSIATLVSCCQGLITVDKEESTVRLIHFTLKEYFSAHPNIFSRPHSAIAEICLTYLNSNQIMALSAELKALSAYFIEDLSNFTHDKPFLEYCSMYWAVHAKKELSDRARSLTLQLFTEYDGHISAALYLERTWDSSGYSGDYLDMDVLWSGLHCASYFGIVEIVAALVEMGFQDLNEGDRFGHTALSLAASAGHEVVVKILLGREEVNPNAGNKFGTTPLAYAAGAGHEGVVEILLGQEEVDPNKPSSNGRTPLSWAAEKGGQGVVGMLLEQEEVNPEKPDNDGRTPLSWAAGSGQKGVVKILLGREVVNPDKPDNYGKTPLSYAALYGREGVVKILLGKEEVNADKPDNEGRTPLTYAALNGLEGVVKILLGLEEVNPDKPSNDGRTPLSYAAEDGHERVMKILLGREEVNPDKPDNHGRTPLRYAVGNKFTFNIVGRLEVVKLLLGREEVNHSQPDCEGQTPLMLAISLGSHEVVALLRSHEAVTHNAT